MIKTMRSKFPNHVPVAHYLVNHSGVVTEKDISKDDVCSARSIARQAISDTGIDILRLVYLRRLIEIDDKIGNAKDAYNMISSVVKRRKVPTVGPEENSPVMSDEERHNANILKDSLVILHMKDIWQWRKTHHPCWLHMQVQHRTMRNCRYFELSMVWIKQMASFGSL